VNPEAGVFRVDLIVIARAAGVLGAALFIVVGTACGGGLVAPQLSESECRALKLTPVAGDFVPGQVIVGFREGTSTEEAETVLKQHALPFYLSTHWEAGNRAALACVRPGQEGEWMERLRENELVEYAHLNHIGHIQDDRDTQ